jgi:hypothetical protein
MVKNKMFYNETVEIVLGVGREMWKKLIKAQRKQCGTVTMNSPVQLIYADKNLFKRKG